MTTDDSDTEGDGESHIPTLQDQIDKVRPQLDALRARLVPEIGAMHSPNSKVLWKALVLYQCLIRRTIELCDGVPRAWSSGEYLTAILLARALTETAAFAWDVTLGIERAI